MEFTVSERRYALFGVMSASILPKDAGGELVKRLLTNNADSKKALQAANELLADISKIPAGKKLDVTVGKPLADITAVEGTDEADTILRYVCTVKQLERRARAIVELFDSDIKPITVKPASKTGNRKQAGGLAAGLINK